MRPAPLVLVIAAMGPACEPSTLSEPTMAEVAGTYVATRLLTTEGDTPTDQLEAGVTLTVTLTADGSTSGSFFVPAEDEESEDFEANLEGTWMLIGRFVSFDHAADTFLRDTSFEYQDGELTADATFQVTRVEVTLTRE